MFKKKIDAQIKPINQKIETLLKENTAIKSEMGEIATLRQQHGESAKHYSFILETKSNEQFIVDGMEYIKNELKLVPLNYENEIKDLDSQINVQNQTKKQVISFVQAKAFASHKDSVCRDVNAVLSGERNISEVTSDDYLMKHFGYNQDNNGGWTNDEKYPNNNGLSFKDKIENAVKSTGIIKSLEEEKIDAKDYYQKKMNELSSPKDEMFYKKMIEQNLGISLENIDKLDDQLTPLHEKEVKLKNELDDLNNKKKKLNDLQPKRSFNLWDRGLAYKGVKEK